MISVPAPPTSSAPTSTSPRAGASSDRNGSAPPSTAPPATLDRGDHDHTTDPRAQHRGPGRLLPGADRYPSRPRRRGEPDGEREARPPPRQPRRRRFGAARSVRARPRRGRSRGRQRRTRTEDGDPMTTATTRKTTAPASRPGAGEIRYQSGFASEFATEALPGALPVGQNSPQRCPYGLYAEQISGTAFTAPRHLNRRTWFYRIRPGALHQPFERIDNGLLTSDFGAGVATPNQLRWDPL